MSDEFHHDPRIAAKHADANAKASAEAHRKAERKRDAKRKREERKRTGESKVVQEATSFLSFFAVAHDKIEPLSIYPADAPHPY